MSARLRLALCTLILLLVPLGAVSAKGAPNKLTVSGPEGTLQLEITDPQLLEHFAMDRFIDFEAPLEAPQAFSSGYELTRYFRVGSNTLKAIDAFVYYPDALGGHGAVFYTGIIDKLFIYGGSPNDGQWFQATVEGDRAIQGLLAEHGVHPAQGAAWASLLDHSAGWLLLRGVLAVAAVATLNLFRRRLLRPLVARSLNSAMNSLSSGSGCGSVDCDPVAGDQPCAVESLSRSS